MVGNTVCGVLAEMIRNGSVRKGVDVQLKVSNPDDTKKIVFVFIADVMSVASKHLSIIASAYNLLESDV